MRKIRPIAAESTDRAQGACPKAGRRPCFIPMTIVITGNGYLDGAPLDVVSFH
ncbi:MAG: hypothetical protein ACJA1L_001947, partial [Paracoccaceae bacterium]